MGVFAGEDWKDGDAGFASLACGERKVTPGEKESPGGRFAPQGETRSAPHSSKLDEGRFLFHLDSA